jgi:hypothetical protein
MGLIDEKNQSFKKSDTVPLDHRFVGGLFESDYKVLKPMQNI